MRSLPRHRADLYNRLLRAPAVPSGIELRKDLQRRSGPNPSETTRLEAGHSLLEDIESSADGIATGLLPCFQPAPSLLPSPD